MGKKEQVPALRSLCRVLCGCGRRLSVVDVVQVPTRVVCMLCLARTRAAAQSAHTELHLCERRATDPARTASVCTRLSPSLFADVGARRGDNVRPQGSHKRPPPAQGLCYSAQFGLAQPCGCRMEERGTPSPSARAGFLEPRAASRRNSTWISSTDLPRVSGVKRAVKSSHSSSTAAKGRKTSDPRALLIAGKPRPTAALHTQLRAAAADMAAARACSGKISAPICHGIGPGPSSKAMTKQRTKETESQLSDQSSSWCALARALPISAAVTPTLERNIPPIPTSSRRRRPAHSIMAEEASIASTLTADASSVPATGESRPAEEKKVVE
mmetsp:Transcript_4829/g.16165  ORF Transcript_4829/g.16165 Transcript_4829/m.16165 type:complete len:328 (-) Transcript_4829:201-1184(-)